MKKQSTVERTTWLEQAYPQMHYLVLALDGDEPAITWLEKNSHGTAMFCRALRGHKPALAALNNGAAEQLDDLFEVIDNEDLSEWMEERRPELHLLFQVVKGDEKSSSKLKPTAKRVASVLREVHQRFLDRTSGGRELMVGDTMADMGCLIGEMHLKQGEYEKAIEAFTRALDTHPSPDLYEGRARAYRGLAERDDSAAALLRQRP